MDKSTPRVNTIIYLYKTCIIEEHLEVLPILTSVNAKLIDRFTFLSHCVKYLKRIIIKSQLTYTDFDSYCIVV